MLRVDLSRFALAGTDSVNLKSRPQSDRQSEAMKNLRIITYIGAAALAGLGMAMAVTNPSQAAYEEYAVQRLTEYLKKDVCTKVPKVFENFLQRNCTVLVDSSRPQIRQIIAQSTQRQNFIFFSIYRTDLSVNQFIPSYHFETVGGFQDFYTYTAEEQ